MPRPKKVEEGSEEEVVVEVPQDQVNFDVFDSKGDFVRSYNTTDSGENAGELAAEFARELNGSVK